MSTTATYEVLTLMPGGRYRTVGFTANPSSNFRPSPFNRFKSSDGKLFELTLRGLELSNH